MGIKKYVALLASAVLGLGLAALAHPPATATAFIRSNLAAIPVADADATGPLPDSRSTIETSGMSAAVTDVNVILKDVSHTLPDDLDIELIGPDNTVVALMSDSCGTTDIDARTLIFDDTAAPLPDGDNVSCGASATWMPSNVLDADPEAWASPPTPNATLAAFNGINPNGLWTLSVGDDHQGDTGQIAGGWSIQITTATAPITIPEIGTASVYPVPIAVSGVSGNITDVNLTIPGLTHNFPADLQMVLQSPTGTAVAIMDRDCGNTDVVDKDFTFDDQAATTLRGACAAGGIFKTTTTKMPSMSSMPDQAPAAPYGTSLAAFNGASPNGPWKLYINDTDAPDGGWISAVPTLTFKTTDVIAPETTFTKKPKSGSKTTAIIAFAASEAGSRFECMVDKSKTFKPCSSPLRLKHLKPGKHKLQVRAIDAAGNVDPTPLHARWKTIRK